MRTALLSPIALLAILLHTGCKTTNELNSKWKQSVGQLQITPVMPLRETLEVGEVYRYLKKPETYYTDGQVEPVTAFRLVNLPDGERSERVWPTFNFSGGSDNSISAVSSAAGILSANLKKTDTLNLTITDSYSVKVPSTAIISELFDVTIDSNKRPLLKIKDSYQDEILSMSALTWKSFFWEYSRNMIFVRIPIEVYYAKKISVTAHQTSNLGGELKIPNEAQLTSVTGNIRVAVNDDSTVTLIEEFDKPMAIGYRAMVIQIWPDTMMAREFPEDAGNWFWNDL